MIGTEFQYGQGFGNQLFCYISTRCLALDIGYQFSTCRQDLFGAPRWNKKGVYFMNIELGDESDPSDFSTTYYEKSDRFFTKTCLHDLTHGCDVSGYDEELLQVPDNTLIYGNLQSEKYFIHHQEKVKKWLKIKSGYDSYDFTRENLCVLNLRGGEYVGLKELHLKQSYWLNAMRNMRQIRSDMKFVIITDDIASAKRILPDIQAYHFDIGKDYVSLKNAKYLILSNSSFAFFPAFTSETVKMIIAPKYWARHNISDGYWGSEQNIYTGWMYQDQAGQLFDSKTCLDELERYKKETRFIEKLNRPIKMTPLLRAKIKYTRFRQSISHYLEKKHA